MKTPTIVATLVAAAFVAGVVYFSRGDSSGDTGSGQVAATNASGSGVTQNASQSAAQAAGSDLSPGSATGGSAATASNSARPTVAASKASPPADPRLDALKVSADNGLIEFVRGPDGKVLSEIDKDPSSPSFRKPLREYVYSGDKVVALMSYRYVGGRVEISRTAVSYKADGSVDRFEQTMRGE